MRCLLAGFTVFSLLLGGAVAASAGAEPVTPARCEVQTGREPQRATPEQAGFDADRLAAALAFADGRNRLNIQVFRHNCLIGEGPDNARTGGVAWNVWSGTKSVVALLAGIASDRGLLDVHAPIDAYLPPGLGDAARRAITVENLLTESSGMQASSVAEGLTAIVPLDPNSAVQALGVPLEHPPGTEFSYSQRNVDLLAWVIELAVGEPLQQFAQRELFDPLGIRRGDYYWARDRSGNTYGHAHLYIPPDDYAKFGLLVAGEGRWAGRQVVSERYLRQALTPSATNSCYGYLFWLGSDCTAAAGFLPDRTYRISGLGMQDVFVLPDLDLVVMWTGAFGNVSAYGPTGVLENTSELPHEFFRRLFAALVDNPFPDPGPYPEPVPDDEPGDLVDPNLLLAVFGLGTAAYPGCDVFSCLNTRLVPPFADAPPGCYLVACLGNDPRTPGIR
ncbi:serine hydrolase domain-containing protein [Nocardia puris]|uniref:serine hydrolase domain-containing protein n=1 Tax=Nocardia puris TaxID=208602 RepID=UPI002B4B1DCB|nr:serine hydrolase [Nocardia puris]